MLAEMPASSRKMDRARTNERIATGRTMEEKLSQEKKQKLMKERTSRTNPRHGSSFVTSKVCQRA